MNEFKELIGKTLTNIITSQHEILFHCKGGESYKLYHEQDCCEYVGLADICGDLMDLIETPIITAEESTNCYDEPTNSCNEDRGDGHETWTFYKIDTQKGGVTIRWYGTSNGHYSEKVDFKKIGVN